MQNTTDENLEPAAPLWVGLDVSKDTLDACLLRPNGKSTHKQFANDASGYAKLWRWVQHAAPEGIVHFCLEATGAYSQAPALFLAEAGQRVSVVNPARIRFFGLAQAQGNKTDKAAAALIARFCRQEAPELWRVAAPEVQLLMALMRRLHAVQELAVQEKNRLSVPSQPAVVIESIENSIAYLEAEIKRLQHQIREHINGHPALKRDSKLLQSIPGIGELTSWDLLAELPDVSQFDSAPGALWADGGLRWLGTARASQRQQRWQAHAIIQAGQHATAKSDVFSGSDRYYVESARQSALRATNRGGQTAHGGVGGVHEKDVDDCLRRVEAPETFRSRLAVTAAS